MKQTALYEIHKLAGAKIIPFAGFYMPIEYSGIIDEHLTVRNSVGVFDVSHMGEIWVTGPFAFQFLQKVTTNDVSKLYDGRIQYSCFPNGKGGIVDDLLVYRMSHDKYLLVVNAANINKDWEWLNSQNKEGAKLQNASDLTSQLAIQGPDAIKTLQPLTTENLSEIKFYTFYIADFAGISDVIISATGYTGSGGFELYFPNKYAESIWKKIMDSGMEYGIKPIGLAARDTLRLEMGYCLYGNDIDDNTSPIEAGLGWITKFAEGKDFIDKEFLFKQKKEGVARKLTGFKLLERGIPRQHYPIVDDSGMHIGEVTSGTMSPMLNAGIGMGYIKTSMAEPGEEVFIEIRNKKLKAIIVSPPFYKK
jgi:aminomethyltransferase